MNEDLIKRLRKFIDDERYYSDSATNVNQCLRIITEAAAALEAAQSEVDKWISRTPLVTGKTRNEARALVGTVMRHKTTDQEYPEVGVVEVNQTLSVIESLIAENEAAQKRIAELEAGPRAMALEWVDDEFGSAAGSAFERYSISLKNGEWIVRV